MRVKWKMLALFVVALAYLSTGWFIVRGNERALVREFGRARQELVSSGLHFCWPWPFVTVDRVNMGESQTVTVGLGAADEVDDSDFLKPLASSRQSEYLTGDKNILHLQIAVQYRVIEPQQYLLSHENPSRHLRYLAQSVVSDLLARSGVDFVHPLGLNALRRRMTAQTRHAVERFGLGIDVEDVTLADVRPPVPVRQSFLDVSNARAERERMLSEAQTVAEQLLAQARAEATQINSVAESTRAQAISSATAEAHRFERLVQQFQSPPLGQDAPIAPTVGGNVARTLTMQRLYWQTLQELLPQFARHVIVDDQQTVDLTIEQPARTTQEPSTSKE